jgi:hypothetical protein
MIRVASVGSFRRTLESVDALVRSCVDCDRYPKAERGAGDVVADCSKTYTSILAARPVGTSGACRVYDLDLQVALVYDCADADAAACVVDDGEAVACCLDAAAATGLSDEQVAPGGSATTSVRYDRPLGGAHVVRVALTVRGVACCGD